MTADKRADILSLARKTIHTEALALKHLEQTLGDDFVCAVELILHSRGKLVVTGMGKSGLIGRKIAATLASTGTPSFFLHPGEAFHGGSGNDLSGKIPCWRFLIRAKRMKFSRSCRSSIPTATS